MTTVTCSMFCSINWYVFLNVFVHNTHQWSLSGFRIVRGSYLSSKEPLRLGGSIYPDSFGKGVDPRSLDVSVFGRKIESDLDIATFDIWRQKVDIWDFSVRTTRSGFRAVSSQRIKQHNDKERDTSNVLTDVTQKFKHVEWLNERQNSAWFRCYEWTIKLLSSGFGFVCRTANTLQLKCLRQGPEQGADEQIVTMFHSPSQVSGKV